MYFVDETEDFVNEKGNGYASNVLLKETGDIWTLKNFMEGVYHYGYSRKKKKKQPLGRASEADEESKIINRSRVNFRRKQTVIDLANCNEQKLPIFYSYVDHDVKDIDVAYQHRVASLKRLERFIRTGKLFGKPVHKFTPQPDFELCAVGILDFQDGKRNPDGEGTQDVHFHQIQNTPYLPQVPVIVAKLHDPETLEFCEHYLHWHQGIYFWSKIACRSTLWFQTVAEAQAYLKSHRSELPGLFFDLHVKGDGRTPEEKGLCVAALLWGHARGIQINKIKDLRKHGKLSNVGEYMVNKYMVANLDDPRLQGRKPVFVMGRAKLEKPRFYRDPDEVENHLTAMHMWAYLVEEKELVGHYIGAFMLYVFNFWMSVYPWIKVYYERKRQKQKMTRADWLACNPQQTLQFSTG
jgi:hypothetical protein